MITLNNPIENHINSVITVLNGSELNLTAIRSYPSVSLPSPVIKPIVCVGINKISFEDCSVGAFLGTDASGKEIYGRKSEIELHISLFSPRKSGGEGAALCIESIAEALLCSPVSGNILSLDFGETVFDRTSAAYVSDGIIKLFAVICSEEKPQRSAERFEIRGETDI